MGAGTAEIGHTADGVRVVLSGEFDVATVPELERSIHERVARASTVTMDMRDVSFVDCEMLDMVVRVGRDLGARGGRLRVEPNLTMQRVFDICGRAAR